MHIKEFHSMNQVLFRRYGRVIKKAKIEDARVVAELALLLWPHHSLEDLEEEMGTYICSDQAAIFMMYCENIAVGFAQCQLRSDYVEGTESSPVGYLEGIFIREAYRKRGLARELLKKCEEWTRQQGCSEFGSDCELTNQESLKFHLKIGFKEANRMICFTKKL